MSKCMLIRAECPRTSDPNAKRFCPAWSDAGVIWKHAETGAEKVVNCGFRAMLPGMVQVIAASNRPAAAIESTRNEIAKGFERMGEIIATGMSAALEGDIPTAIPKVSTPQQIEG